MCEHSEEVQDGIDIKLSMARLRYGKDLSLCSYCSDAWAAKLLHFRNQQDGFSEVGFPNWKNALSRFKSHEFSGNSVANLYDVNPQEQDCVSAQLNSAGA